MKGKVYLVGAGCGDEGLITVKGLEVIKKATAIVYDELANAALLKHKMAQCETIYVGKKAGNHAMSQENIHKLLAEKASEGKTVVRLKGGDPYVFGRGGEEGEFLYDVGIDFEVIPGITSAIGGLAYGGIPITHRGMATSFHVITGHLKSEKDDLEWDAFAKLKGTLVFLMGVGNLKKITTRLLQEGINPQKPAAVIYKASLLEQKVIQGTVENIYELAQENKIKPPSLIVIGDVVKKRKSLNFFERKPLQGKTVVVTRARAQNSTLVEQIQELGGKAIEYPTIRIQPIHEKELAKQIQEIDFYTHLIFTSANGVEIFFRTQMGLGMDARNLGTIQVTAIGSGTAQALEKYGIQPDFIPERYISEEVVELLKPHLQSTDKILIPRSKDAREYLVQELRKICHVTEIHTYQTVREDNKDVDLLELNKEKKIDYITFTSSSTVKNFVEQIGKENLKELQNTKFISIGPITGRTMEKYGLSPYAQAQEYTIQGMIDILLEE